ncbi:Neurotransmitter-gated ion-channel transmembrane domain [Trinorchestia longiramus]|nr:Neurotransmitter-gated ion-channel transmembrane domain [Trinorchestia longiramus]
MWVPVVDFTNTKGNHYTLADHESTMMVNMQSLPYMGDDARAEEVEVYPGTKNSLSIRRKYSKTFQCQFDLTRYPFDKQGCEMELTMLSASSRLLQFDEVRTAAEFSGNRHLIEYVHLVSESESESSTESGSESKSESGSESKSESGSESKSESGSESKSESGSGLNCYLTLYFKPAIFQVRMLGSLTTLLVMATLFTQVTSSPDPITLLITFFTQLTSSPDPITLLITLFTQVTSSPDPITLLITLFTQASSQLPKSSYFKLVDVWLLSSILIIFTIIVFHAIIDRLQDTPKPAIPKHPLSAIIIKPDIGQGRNFKPRRSKKSQPESAKPPSRSRSKGSEISSAVSRNSMDVVRVSSPAPHTPEHEEHELVTTFAHLGVENESPATSKTKEENSRKRANNKIGDHVRTDNSSSSAMEAEDNGITQPDTNATVGQTYREPRKAKNGDSFIAMERADSDGEDSEDDVGRAILRRGIEWKFWKWSFNDVDKCKTMIVSSRIVVFLMVLIFNIIYWSIALNAE